MKLDKFLEDNEMRPSQLAATMGVPASTVTRLLSGQNKNPSFELLKKIAWATSGLVTPNDFLSSPATKDAPRASGKKKAKK